MSKIVSMYILMDVDKMARDDAQKEFDSLCIFNPYVVIDEVRRLDDFWQRIFDIKLEKHRERLIQTYGKSEEEIGAYSSNDTGEGDGV